METLYHIFSVFGYKGGELCSDINLTLEEAVHILYLDRDFIDYLEGRCPKNKSILDLSDNEFGNIMDQFYDDENVFGTYGGNEEFTIPKVYTVNSKGKLIEDWPPKELIIYYIKESLKKYG